MQIIRKITEKESTIMDLINYQIDEEKGLTVEQRNIFNRMFWQLNKYFQSRYNLDLITEYIDHDNIIKKRRIKNL